jgi:hypothetical protein
MSPSPETSPLCLRVFYPIGVQQQVERPLHLCPRAAFSTMARSTDQCAKEIREVPRAFRPAMDRTTNDIARSDQKLNQKRSGVVFRMRFNQLHEVAGKSMKRRLV